MNRTDIECARTCAGVCTALNAALSQERKKTIELIEATTETLRARFGTLHDIQESFEL
jgi:hypothetical protein